MISHSHRSICKKLSIYFIDFMPHVAAVLVSFFIEHISHFVFGVCKCIDVYFVYPLLGETANKTRRAKVTFSYTPENEDELALEVGEVVDVYKQVSEFLYIENCSTR